MLIFVILNCPHSVLICFCLKCFLNVVYSPKLLRYRSDYRCNSYKFCKTAKFLWNSNDLFRFFPLQNIVFQTHSISFLFSRKRKPIYQRIVEWCAMKRNKRKSFKIQLRPYTTAKLMLKSLKNVQNPTFRRSTASSGIRKNIPRGAYIQM